MWPSGVHRWSRATAKRAAARAHRGRGAGSYPAVINVLLGCCSATTGRGCYIDISMNDNLLPFMYWAIGAGLGAGSGRAAARAGNWGSPRYNLPYRG